MRSENKDEVERQGKDYRRFRELTGEWVNLALELCKLKMGSGKEPEG